MGDSPPEPPQAWSRTTRGLPRRAAVALAVGLTAGLIAAAAIDGRQAPDGPPPRDGLQTAGADVSADLRPVDGGLRYYSRFPRSLPTSDGYFPIGVWMFVGQP